MKTFKYFMLMNLLFAFYQTKAQNSTVAVNQVLQDYLSVEKALVNDDSRAANKQATILVNSIANINTAQLGVAQKTAWANYGEKLRYNSQHISESKSIGHQREHFAVLSDEMYGLLKSFKTHPTLYREYCPMKKQYWLNTSKEIQNPYYGKEMPDCGKVTETIKGAASAIPVK